MVIKKLSALFVLLSFLVMPFSPKYIFTESSSRVRLSSPPDVIDAVNALRASYGLPPYNINSILMGNAQKQAEYNLSISTITHTSPDGLSPLQRALTAGYPVSSGFFSENIAAGVGLSAEGAVEIWEGDGPHLNTMISTNLQDIGAGVAFNGNTFYYVIDCGLSTGGTPVAFTPPPSYRPPAVTLPPNTPNADGSITYTIQTGDTALSIAISYGLSLDALLHMNGLTTNSVIYPYQIVILRVANSPTPPGATYTPTERYTITPWPTSSPTSYDTPISPTSLPSPGLPVSEASGTMAAIIFSALLISAIIVLVARKRI